MQYLCTTFYSEEEVSYLHRSQTSVVVSPLPPRRRSPLSPRCRRGSGRRANDGVLRWKRPFASPSLLPSSVYKSTSPSSDDENDDVVPSLFLLPAFLVGPTTPACPPPSLSPPPKAYVKARARDPRQRERWVLRTERARRESLGGHASAAVRVGEAEEDVGEGAREEREGRAGRKERE